MSNLTEREWVESFPLQIPRMALNEILISRLESKEATIDAWRRSCEEMQAEIESLRTQLIRASTARDEFRLGYEQLAERLKELDAENLALKRKLEAIEQPDHGRDCICDECLRVWPERNTRVFIQTS